MIAAMSDSNPYNPIRSEANDVFRELLKIAKDSDEIDVEDPSKFHPHWTILNHHVFSDLQQSPYCTGLDIKVDHPLMILKDRHYLR